MTVTEFIWDELSDNLLVETGEAGDAIATYSQEPDQFGELISQDREGVVSGYHFDGLGSTRQLTDENQDVTDEYTFSAFGEKVASSGNTVNPFGFQGSVGYYANPSTEDLYVRARHYRPSIGMWLSVDPAGLVDGPNPYTYSNNSPATLSDPSGLVVYCGLLEIKCKASKVLVPVYGLSAQAAAVLALGGIAAGCYTTLSDIKCTMGCNAIKMTRAASTPPPKTVPILWHEACHYCLLKDPLPPLPYGGWIPYNLLMYLCSAGSAPDACVGKERPAKAEW